MALISQMYGLGGSSSNSSNSILPAPPSKAKYNTSEYSAVTGGGKTAYQFWDVRDVIAGHTFGISSGDGTSFSRSYVMVLRNDTTGTTVWTKAYTDFPWDAVPGTSEGHVRLVSAVFDLVDGFVYLLGWRWNSATGGKYNLFKTTITTGTTTRVMTLPVGLGEPRATEQFENPVSFGRFTDSTRKIIEFFGLGTAVNTWRSIVINIASITVISNSAVTPLTLFAGESYNGLSLQDTATFNACINYVTRDKKIAVSFLPNKSVSNGYGSLVVYRRSGRALATVASPLIYQFPGAGGTGRGMMGASDSLFTYSLRAAGTSAGVGDPMGSLDAYDMNDMDRWLTEIADEAGLPAGVALW